VECYALLQLETCCVTPLSCTFSCTCASPPFSSHEHPPLCYPRKHEWWLSFSRPSLTLPSRRSIVSCEQRRGQGRAIVTPVHIGPTMSRRHWLQIGDRYRRVDVLPSSRVVPARRIGLPKAWGASPHAPARLTAYHVYLYIHVSSRRADLRWFRNKEALGVCLWWGRLFRGRLSPQGYRWDDSFCSIETNALRRLGTIFRGRASRRGGGRRRSTNYTNKRQGAAYPPRMKRSWHKV
jgi:hypothetical protein